MKIVVTIATEGAEIGDGTVDESALALQTVGSQSASDVLPL
jgi:hypothetical protein